MYNAHEMWVHMAHGKMRYLCYFIYSIALAKIDSLHLLPDLVILAYSF